MGLENLLNHSCNIYHIQEGKASPGYGLAAAPSFSYPEKADISEQECHFGVKSQSVTVTQTAPANLIGHHLFVYIKRTGGQKPL